MILATQEKNNKKQTKEVYNPTMEIKCNYKKMVNLSKGEGTGKRNKEQVGQIENKSKMVVLNPTI